MDAFKRHMAVDSDATVRTELYELFDADAGRCTLPLKLVAGTFASDKGLHFNPWLEAAAPRFKVLMGGHTAHAEHDAAAAANPAVFFSNEYMLRHGATPLVEAFSFIGLPKEGSDSLANALATLLKYSFRVSLLPNSIEKGANGPIDLRQAKEASLRGLQRAGIRAMQEYAANIIIMSKTPLHEAAKPTAFAPTDGGLRVELLTIEENLKPIDAEVKPVSYTHLRAHETP